VRPQLALAAACAVAGLACLSYAASQGQANVGVALVVPFVVGTGPWASVGVLLLGLAMVLGFAAVSTRAVGEAPGKPTPDAPASPESSGPPPARKVGGFILLGPIPIAFGTTRGLALAMLAAALVMLAVLLLAGALGGTR
jgi:uncharacterized membrane protein